MPKKLTQEEFIERANKVHNGKYDYSKVDYINSGTKVCIICPIHGEFWQTPNHHLKKHGCIKCRNEYFSNSKKNKSHSYQKRKICGVGVNDMDCILKDDIKRIYYIWSAMIKRCYDKSNDKYRTYHDCEVCDEWKYFSNFYKWYTCNYVDGWCLDKDILSKNVKIYSPQTCCFVPNEINVMFNRHQNRRGESNICGVRKHYNKYEARISKFGKTTVLGYFKNKEEALMVYRENKKQYICEMANIWKNKLDTNVYNALINYNVEVED